MRVIFNPSNTGTQFLHLSETVGIVVSQGAGARIMLKTERLS